MNNNGLSHVFTNSNGSVFESNQTLFVDKPISFENYGIPLKVSTAITQVNNRMKQVKIYVNIMFPNIKCY